MHGRALRSPLSERLRSRTSGDESAVMCSRSVVASVFYDRLLCRPRLRELFAGVTIEI
jgi:hypothetical protein